MIWQLGADRFLNKIQALLFPFKVCQSLYQWFLFVASKRTKIVLFKGVDLGRHNSEDKGRTLSRQAELAPDGRQTTRAGPGRRLLAGIQLARGFIIPRQVKNFKRLWPIVG